MSTFRKDLESLINRYSIENGSDTPDFILADYLNDCLQAFDKAVVLRHEWYIGREERTHARTLSESIRIAEEEIGVDP